MTLSLPKNLDLMSRMFFILAERLEYQVCLVEGAIGFG